MKQGKKRGKRRKTRKEKQEDRGREIRKGKSWSGTLLRICL